MPQFSTPYLLLLGDGTLVSLPTSDGTAGSPLLTNADGTASWSTLITDNGSGIGIGDTSPSYPLSIRAANNHIAMTDTDDSLQYRLSVNSGHFFLVDNSVASTPFRVQAGASSNMLSITSTDRVGIGTASPGAKLDVLGNVASTVGLIVQGAASQTAKLQEWQDNSSTVVGSMDNSGNFVAQSTVTTNYNVALVGMQTPDLYSSTGNLTITAGNNASSTGELIFETNNAGTATERVRIDETGNVGIGTTSPATLLTLEEAVLASTPMLTIHANTSTTGAGGTIDFANSSQVSAIGARIASHRLGTGAYSDLRFSVLPSGGSLTEAMRIDSTGFVGIGTTSPDTIFEIQQSADDNGLRVTGSTASTQYCDINLDVTGYTNIDATLGFRFKKGGSNVAFIDNSTSNGFRIYDDIPLTFGATSSTRYGMERDSVSGNLRIAYSGMGTDFINIDSSGNVGIGTTSPGALLHTAISGTGDAFKLERTDANGFLEIDFVNQYTNYNSELDHVWKVGGTEVFRIDNNGDLQIPDTTDVAFTNVSGQGFLNFRGSINRLAIGGTATSLIEFNDNCDLQNYDIYNVGQLGIGTSSPTTVFEIELDNAGTAAPSTANAIQIINTNATANNFSSLVLSQITGGVAGAAIAGIHTGRSGGSRTSELGLYYYDQATSASPIEAMRIDSAGNVGIGTDSPNGTLHVQTASTGATPNAAADDLVIENTGANTGITLLSGTGNFCNIYFGDSADVDRGRINYNHATDSMAFRTNAVDAVTIDSSQQVGIGTTSPNNRVEIEDNAAQLRVSHSTDPGAYYAELVSNYNASNPFNLYVKNYGNVMAVGQPTGYTGSSIAYIDGFYGSALCRNGNLGLFLDTTLNVGIGTDSPSAPLHIDTTGTDDSLLITNDDATADAAPVITLKRDSASPADGDYLGQIKFKGENDASQEIVYAKITGKTSDVTDTTEDGLIETAVKANGSNLIVSRQTHTDLKLINGIGLQVDGDVGIGTTSPEASVHVVGPDGAGTTPTIDAFGTVAIFENNSDIESNSYISLIAGTDGFAGINFGDENDENIGRINYDHFDDELEFWTNTSQQMVIDSSGNVGIGTATPQSSLSVFTPTASSARENIIEATTGESTYSKFGMGNLTTSSNIFIPQVYGYNNDDGRAGFSFLGLVSNDILINNHGAIDLNSGSIPANSADPLNATRSPLSNHNILSVRNDGTQVFTIAADGSVGIGTTSPNNIFHVYENNINADSGAGVLIEQDGTGDAQLSWRLTGTKEYTAGIDNSDGDKWKLTESGNEIIVANGGSGDLEFGNDSTTGDYIFNHQGPDWALSYRNAGTEYARLHIDASNGEFDIAGDSSQTPVLRLTNVYGGSSIANGVNISGDYAGYAPVISAYGTDSNIDLVLKPKGTGTIELSTTDSGTGTELQRLYWDSSSPADNDALTQTIYGETDLGNAHQYGEQRWIFNDVTDGTEDATYQLYLSSVGTLRQQLRLSGTGGGTELNHDGPNIPIGLLVHSKNASDTDETEGMLIEHHRGGAVGGNGLGTRYSIGLENSSGSVHAAGGMGIRWTDATDTSEDSEFFVKLYEAGAETEAMSINSSGNMTTAGTVTTGGSGTGQSTIAAGLVVNDDGGGAATDDFRAETNNEANALVVDASADQVNLGVVLKLPYLGAAPSTLENGMIWMESDGLHIYYAGTERVVAGI